MKGFKLSDNDSLSKDQRSKLWESYGEEGSNKDSPPNSPQTSDGKQFYGEVARDEEAAKEDDEEDKDEPLTRRHKGSSNSKDYNQFNLFVIQEHELSSLIYVLN